jgi:hypothetical protein
MYERSPCNRILGLPFSGYFVQRLLSGDKVTTWRARTTADVGALLWVRETYAPLPGGGYLYRSDVDASDIAARPNVQRWHPSIHCPRKAARIWLRVLGREQRRRRQATETDAALAGFPTLAAFLAYPMPDLCVVLRFERCAPPPVRQLELPFPGGLG